MTTFTLKLIALSSMLIDHMGAAFPQHFGFGFRIVGRIAFPIFVYLVAEGFRHTKSPEKFIVRLGIFAIVSEPFFDLALRANWSGMETGGLLPFILHNINFLANTNIFLTLFLGGCAIVSYKKFRDKADGSPLLVYALTALTTAVFMGAAHLLTTDYGAYGVFFILIMYAIKPTGLRLVAMIPLTLWQHRNILLMPFTGFASAISHIHVLLVLATALPVLLIVFYNGKRGPSLKWLFYAAYPVHLAVITVILFLTHLT